MPRVGDLASIEGGLPAFHIPMVPLTWETLQIILPYALILAAIGLIESLLTLNLVGEITGKRGGASQECVAQGVGQHRHRLLRRHGRLRDDRPVDDQREIRRPARGCRASRRRCSCWPSSWSRRRLIEQIPLAALVGVMFMVVIGTFAWNSLTILRQVPLTDARGHRAGDRRDGG